MSGLRLGSKLLALTALNLSLSPLVPLLFLLTLSLLFDFVIEAEVGLEVGLFMEPFGRPLGLGVEAEAEVLGRGGLKGFGGIFLVRSSAGISNSASCRDRAVCRARSGLLLDGFLPANGIGTVATGDTKSEREDVKGICICRVVWGVVRRIEGVSNAFG